MLFVIVLNYMLYRSFRSLAAILITMAVSAAAAVGYIGLTGGTFSLVSSVMPMTVLITATTTLQEPLVSDNNQQEQFGTRLPTVQGDTFLLGGPGTLFVEAGRIVRGPTDSAYTAVAAAKAPPPCCISQSPRQRPAQRRSALSSGASQTHYGRA